MEKCQRLSEIFNDVSEKIDLNRKRLKTITNYRMKTRTIQKLYLLNEMRSRVLFLLSEEVRLSGF